MILNETFNHNIIIHASGEYQIRLLTLIYASINKNQNKSFLYGSGLFNFHKQYESIIVGINSNLKYNFKNNNLKPNVLYCPNRNALSFDKGTIYTKNKLDKYYLTKQSNLLKGDYFLENLSRKIELANYRLINMKELIDLYGKYLFKDNNHKEEFINNYSMLSNCNVYKTIKNIET